MYRYPTVNPAKRFLVILLIAVIGACATYQAKPLIMKSDQFNAPQWTTEIPPAQAGFSMDQVATLAVLNNPTLKLARDDVGIAQAQAFAAGLLPDPQFAFGYDFPTNQQSQPGITTASNFGLNFDLQALLAIPYQKKAAGAQQQQVELTLLWQEWQVANQARLLFIKQVQQQKQLQLLQSNEALLKKQYQAIDTALKDHNATLDAASASYQALNDNEQQINELMQAINQNHHDFNILLGLPLEVNLPLSSSFNITPLDDKKINEEMQQLVYRRPDLLALKAGYESQDARYRLAILQQFPAITLGPNKAEDNTSVKSIGFAVTINLPLFNRNRGNIAIEKATRQRLYDDFQNRVNSSYSDLKLLLANQALLESKLKELNVTLAQLQEVEKNADIALQSGDIANASAIRFKMDYFNKQIQVTLLEEQLLEQRLAIQIALGGPLPSLKETQ